MNGFDHKARLDTRAACVAKTRLGRTHLLTMRASHVRVLMPPMDDEVSNVRNPGKGVSENKDRIAIMDKGKIIAEGSPSELISRYCPGEVLRFSIDGDEREVKI